MLYTLPLTKNPLLTLVLSTRLLSKTQNYSSFLSRMTKGKTLRGHHLVIIGRVSIILIILIIKRGLRRRRGRRSKTSHASLSMSNASYSSVHFTHLISESVQMTTKVNMHSLKLLHDGLEGHTTSCRGGTAKATGSVISTRGRFVLGSFQRSPSWSSHQKTRYEMEQEEE